MNDEYPDLSFARHDWHSGAHINESTNGQHGYPADADASFYATYQEENWDPVEELTNLLQDAATTDPAPVLPPPRGKPSSDVAFTDDPMHNLTQITAELPPIRHPSTRHRRMRVRRLRFTWLQTASFVIAALAAVIVSMVSVFGGMVAYAPLRHIASGSRGSALTWWPLLIYGPWMVASLSILRSALHQRRSMHSWFVVLLFSSFAMMLCMVEAKRTLTGMTAAALPAVASLSCFQQLVRQITLTRPPRDRTSRHRQHPIPAARKSSETKRDPDTSSS